MRPHKLSRWRIWAGSFGLAVLVLIWSLATSCHGSVIRRDYVPNHRADFDFGNPPCAVSEVSEASAASSAGESRQVRLRYLGVSGVYIEWQGVGLLSAPFFSNYGEFRAAFGSVDWQLDAIEAGERPSDLPKDIDTDASPREIISNLLDRHGTGRVLFRNTRAAIKGFPIRVVHAYPLPAPDQYIHAQVDLQQKLQSIKIILRS